MGVDWTSIFGVRLIDTEKKAKEPEAKKPKHHEDDPEDYHWIGDVSGIHWEMTEFNGDEVVVFSTVDQDGYPKVIIDLKELQKFLADFNDIIETGQGELINFVK